VTRGSPGAALRQKVDAGVQVTRGGPGAVLSHGGTWRPRSCPEPRGHPATSELPLAGRREPLSWLRACTRGYPVLRVPTVAPEPTPEEAANPRVGPASFPRAAFLSLYVLGFRSGGAARLIRGDPRFVRTLRCSRNCHAPQFLVGRYCSAEIAGPEVIMTMIPEPMGHCAYGIRGDSVSAPTDERGLDPLVSAWVCRARDVGMKRHARWAVAY
jgi:hypothetical protein